MQGTPEGQSLTPINLHILKVKKMMIKTVEFGADLWIPCKLYFCNISLNLDYSEPLASWRWDPWPQSFWDSQRSFKVGRLGRFFENAKQENAACAQIEDSLDMSKLCKSCFQKSVSISFFAGIWIDSNLEVMYALATRWIYVWKYFKLLCLQSDILAISPLMCTVHKVCIGNLAIAVRVAMSQIVGLWQYWNITILPVWPNHNIVGVWQYAPCPVCWLCWVCIANLIMTCILPSLYYPAHYWRYPRIRIEILSGEKSVNITQPTISVIQSLSPAPASPTFERFQPKKMQLF